MILFVAALLFWRPWQKVVYEATTVWGRDLDESYFVDSGHNSKSKVWVSVSLVPEYVSAYAAVPPYTINVLCYAPNDALSAIQLVSVEAKNQAGEVVFSRNPGLVSELEPTFQTFYSVAGAFERCSFSVGSLDDSQMVGDMIFNISVVPNSGAGQEEEVEFEVMMIRVETQGNWVVPQV